MLYVQESSGYRKSVRNSLSSSRNQSKKKKASQQCEDILLNINSMMNRLDYLQQAIENRNQETRAQIKKYIPPNYYIQEAYFTEDKENNYEKLNCYHLMKKFETEKNHPRSEFSRRRSFAN
ncbi:unnamed protein product (macronuclear) [Paramecium tetraurelia]|uniref:Uncharacterized protein n=1 Tax=Paramecium tetraurelia TaxID=5888 RepID=A0C0Q2_PARTE|nr:uncharacterized protein GSPATT00033845001 [Paramecium tetraurelia]CAK64369.1 unnamed protein product [Paramecium tetraurelia]|eukprot:XP_001431767.1 hypothetical protein (macronuclear) [Paramecium tetraurelia strain d4-2]